MEGVDEETRLGPERERTQEVGGFLGTFPGRIDDGCSKMYCPFRYTDFTPAEYRGTDARRAKGGAETRRERHQGSAGATGANRAAEAKVQRLRGQRGR